MAAGGAPPEGSDMRLGSLGAAMVGALALLGAVQANAGSLPFVGSLSISVAGFPVSAIGSGTAIVSTTGNHIDALSIPASPFNAVARVAPVTDPAAAPIKGIQATFHNGGGAFAGSALGGPMTVNGIIKVCLFRVCSNAFANMSVPLTHHGQSRPGLTGTVTFGVGGILTVYSDTAGSTTNLTLRGAPWTAGVAAIGTITQMGFAHGPASGSSSTAQASGAIRLVTPFFISTNIGASAVVPTFGILDLHFVPEPSTLLLLAGGIAGLVMVGRSKRS